MKTKTKRPFRGKFSRTLNELYRDSKNVLYVDGRTTTRDVTYDASIQPR